MQSIALLLLRFSIGFLLIIWGVDKLVDIKHALYISNTYYYGLLSGQTAQTLLTVVGALEMTLGFIIIIGLLRRWVYFLLMLVTATTLLAVSKSVIDPWGWYLKGTNVLFYPSLIIFAGALVLFAFRNADTIALDRGIGLAGKD